MAKFGIGQAVPRSEDPRLLTGQGSYTDDVTLPGQRYAYFVRSPFAHAELGAIDVSEARAAPGVVAVLTGADMQADGVNAKHSYATVKNRDGSDFVNVPWPGLAQGRVRYVGEAVAMVIAETIGQARDAAELVDVDYETLPAVAATGAAMAPGTPQIWDRAPDNLCFDWEYGEREPARALLDQAAHVVDLTLVNNRVVANSMEGRACNAHHDPETGISRFYVSSQGVHSLRDKLARDIFGIDPDRLQVFTTDVGGGFGMKIFLYPEYIATLYAARKLGCAVKWTAERSEGFVSDDHGRDNITRVRLGLDAEHRFTALFVETTANLGAYLSDFGVFVATAAGNRMLPGLYTLQRVYTNVKGVFTNTQPVDAYRGAGRPEAAFIIERVVDLAAIELGVDPVALRHKNYIPPQAMPFTTATGLVYDSGEFSRNLGEAVERADRAGFEARRAAAAAEGRLRGLGVATYVEACAGGGPEDATITVDRDGSVTILIGTQTNGQGHETAYKQIVAEHLGVEFDRMTMIQGDTTRVATGSGTGGSRSVPVGGASVAEAALKIRDKARVRAADMLEAAAADIVVEDGRFTVIGTDRSVSLAEIAARAEDAVAFAEGGKFTPPAHTFPNGAHVVEVEIDPDTGTVTILRYTVVDDFGNVLNPMMVAGQVHGGVAQGIGQALLEHTVYDADGQLLSGSFMDYAMPRADNLPFLDFKYTVIPCRTNPMGVKGAGEAGCIGAPPAVINAVVDALKPYGITHIDMPATPSAIWQAIRSARPAAAAE